MSSDVELNEIGILRRREIEARILAPILEALGKQFGRAEVLEITAKTVREIARQQGKELASQLGKNDLEAYGKSVENWSQGGALRLQILHQDDRTLEFDVTECQYAALYRSLGIEELGSSLSCGRDAAFVEGFSTAITLERGQTIMQGAEICHFCFKADSH